VQADPIALGKDGERWPDIGRLREPASKGTPQVALADLSTPVGSQIPKHMLGVSD
jgi:hypothetical protein